MPQETGKHCNMFLSGQLDVPRNPEETAAEYLNRLRLTIQGLPHASDRDAGFGQVYAIALKNHLKAQFPSADIGAPELVPAERPYFMAYDSKEMEKSGTASRRGVIFQVAINGRSTFWVVYYPVDGEGCPQIHQQGSYQEISAECIAELTANIQKH